MSGKKPVFSQRVGGIQISVWGNETEKGIMHSITMSKSYKDGKTGEWKTTSNFKPNDVALLKIGLDKAMEFIYIKDVVKEEF